MVLRRKLRTQEDALSRLMSGRTKARNTSDARDVLVGTVRGVKAEVSREVWFRLTEDFLEHLMLECRDGGHAGLRGGVPRVRHQRDVLLDPIDGGNDAVEPIGVTACDRGLNSHFFQRRFMCHIDGLP